MDFLKNHRYITNSEFKKLEDFVVSNLKKFKNEGKSVNFAIDKTRDLIWNTFIETNFLQKYSSRLRNIYSTYIYSFENYDHTGDITMSVLKNEVFNDFKIIKELNIVGQSTYLPEIEDLIFENFVSALLKYDVAQKSYKRLSNNSDLYKLFYLQNNFENFTLKHFEGHVVNSELYKKLFKKFHPKKPLPIAIQIIDEYKNTIYKIEEESEVKSKITIRESNEKKSKVDFTIEEKSFLFFILCDALKNEKNTDDKASFNLPNTELLRLVSIINFYDDKSFTNRYRDSVHYKILSKNIEYFDKNEIMIFLDTLISKLEYYNLNKTIKHAKEIRNKTHNILIKNKSQY